MGFGRRHLKHHKSPYIRTLVFGQGHRINGVTPFNTGTSPAPHRVEAGHHGGALLFVDAFAGLALVCLAKTHDACGQREDWLRKSSEARRAFLVGYSLRFSLWVVCGGHRRAATAASSTATKCYSATRHTYLSVSLNLFE
jgi:hypothetical protein